MAQKSDCLCREVFFVGSELICSNKNVLVQISVTADVDVQLLKTVYLEGFDNMLFSEQFGNFLAVHPSI